MNIAMFASEANPLCKTGGLADVVYSLSVELAKEKNKVIIGLPLYKSIASSEKWKGNQYVGTFTVYMGWREQKADLFEKTIDGVSYYLIANDYYFGRDRLYGYNDDGERFAFFSSACRILLKYINFKADIVHVHDWQAAFIPTLIREKDSLDPFYKHMKFVLTIHNPAFKGLFDRYFLNDFYGLPDELYDSGKVRFEGMVSTLKSGIVYSDKITTVSPTHREELIDEGSSHGLSGVLKFRAGDFVGILNGIDTTEWNPLHDPFIAKNYSATKLEEGKHLNQADLLKAFNIKWFGGPVYGLVSRLSWQKGMDLALASGRNALKKGANLVILGSGEYEFEQKFEALRKEFPDTCGIYIGYNNDLAHKVYAGSDFFLMPSLFEPCGISQMISQRYGTLPLVRYTGGLCDTVHGFNAMGTEGCDGIGFNDYNEQGIEYAFEMSRQLYANQKEYYDVARNAMKLDRSWKKSASLYTKLYESIKK